MLDTTANVVAGQAIVGVYRGHIEIRIRRGNPVRSSVEVWTAAVHAGACCPGFRTCKGEGRGSWGTVGSAFGAAGRRGRGRRRRGGAAARRDGGGAGR